jgi:putative flippase GtrA
VNRSRLRWLYDHPPVVRLRRFFLVGVVAAGIQTALLWTFVESLGFWYLLAAPIVIEITIVLQFFINNAWTFRVSQHTTRWSLAYGLVKTNVVRGTAIPIQTGLLYMLADWLGLMYLVANLGAIFVSGFYRYLLDSRWTWQI